MIDMFPKEPFLVWFGHLIVRMLYLLTFISGIAFSIYWIVQYLEF